MLSLGTLGFASPWLLLALFALPALWLILRAVPPLPREMGFPGVRLLIGLRDAERMPERTPLWLLLLRCLVAALVIFAFAEPLLNPGDQLRGRGPVVILFDGDWASAPDWEERQQAAQALLAQAERQDRLVVLAQSPSNKITTGPRPFQSDTGGAVAHFQWQVAENPL